MLTPQKQKGTRDVRLMSCKASTTEDLQGKETASQEGRRGPQAKPAEGSSGWGRGNRGQQGHTGRAPPGRLMCVTMSSPLVRLPPLCLQHLEGRRSLIGRLVTQRVAECARLGNSARFLLLLSHHVPPQDRRKATALHAPQGRCGGLSVSAQVAVDRQLQGCPLWTRVLVDHGRGPI